MPHATAYTGHSLAAALKHGHGSVTVPVTSICGRTELRGSSLLLLQLNNSTSIDLLRLRALTKRANRHESKTRAATAADSLHAP
jgi:hypothetical protein